MTTRSSSRPSGLSERPRSEQLVDLHIYVVPRSLWQDDLNSVSNDVINNCVSAGFVRVLPEYYLRELRDEIVEQISPYGCIPPDYVFLRSVGRCLTQVKPKQEVEMKVKSYLPPQAYLPEIFLLESGAFDKPDISSAPPDSNRHNYDKDRRVVPYHLQGHGGGYPGSGGAGGGARGHNNRHPGTNSSFLPHVTPQHTPHPPLTGEGDFSDEPYQMERLDSGHSDDHHLPRVSASLPNTPKSSSSKNNSHDSPSQQGDSQEQEERPLPPLSCTPPNSALQRQPESKEDSGISTVTPPEELERQRVEELLRKQQQEEEAEKRKKEEEAEKIKKLEEAERQRKKLEQEERRRKKEEAEKRRKELEEERQRIEEERKHYEEERKREEEEERHRKDERQRKEEEKQRKEEERHKKEEEKRRKEEEERWYKKMAEEKRKREEEEQRRREEEEEEMRRQEEEERREEEERLRKARFPSPPAMDDAEAKQREKEQLLKELELARQERKEIEKKREDLVKKAKNLQTKTQSKRNQARDMWKKKYFEEKKKTPPLEEQSTRLRTDLESVHKRLMAQMEGGKDKPAVRTGNKAPGEQNNLKIQATKLKHDIGDVKRKVDNIKMKLTAEMKLRNQAETELRALRAELTQKKINISLTRSQQLNALGSTADITPRTEVSPR